MTTPDPAELLFDRRCSGWHWRHTRAVLDDCPPVLQAALAERYAAISGESRRYYCDGTGRVLDTWNDAAHDLLRTGRELHHVKPRVAFNDDEIEAAADRSARQCWSMKTPAAIEYATRQGMTIPEGPRVTARSVRRRLCSSDWWRRRLRTRLTRSCEELFRRLGFVRAQASAYVSGDALARVRSAAAKGRRWMAETSAVCEDTGEMLPLAEIAEHSLANPTLRRGELMLRARGFQEIAGLRGDRCLMVTATCPSAFHPWLKDSGTPNPLYNGSTPRDAQRWLNQHWARARAALRRKSVLYYGFRAAEPHHDATPHWHLVLYVPADQVEIVKRVMGKTWLRDYPDEPGAERYRIKFTDEDPSKGSGVGYLAKYVAKNIDGAGSIGGEVSDESGRPLADDAQHAVAWARVHGIRQFQQLGGPAVTLWRELRRVREPCEWPPLEALRLCVDGEGTPFGSAETHCVASGLRPSGAPPPKQNSRAQPGSEFSTCRHRRSDFNEAEPDCALEESLQTRKFSYLDCGTKHDLTRFNEAASASSPPIETGPEKKSVTGPSWSRFIEQLGGIGPSLKASRALFDKAEPRTTDREGRRVLRLTRWGEMPAPMVIGLQIVWHDRIRRLPTRLHVWFLVFAPRSGGAPTLGPVATTVLGAASVGSPAAWTNPNETSQAPPRWRSNQHV